jgi:hypothetical protein
MTVRSFAKRWLEFAVVYIPIFFTVEYFRHGRISREDLIGVLPIVLGMGLGAAVPPREHNAAGRLGFRLGQKLREYRGRHAEG